MLNVKVYKRKSPYSGMTTWCLQYRDPETGQEKRIVTGVRCEKGTSSTERRKLDRLAERIAMLTQEEMDQRGRRHVIPMKLPDALNEFCAYLTTDGPGALPNGSPQSIANIERRCAGFVQWIATRNSQRRCPRWIGTVLTWDIATYRDHLASEGMAHSTINVTISSIRKWFGWAVDYGHASINPCIPVKLYRLETKRPVLPVKTAEDLWALVAKLDEDLRAPVILLACTGARQGEIKELEWGHVDEAAKTATLRAEGENTTKGGPRTVPLTSQAMQALDGKDRQAKYIFTARNGKPLTSQIGKALKPHGVNPHDLRRFYIRAIELTDAPQRVINDLVGHSPSKAPKRDDQDAPGASRGRYTEASNVEAAWPWVRKFEAWLGNGVPSG